jgi:hypothetical protein
VLRGYCVDLDHHVKSSWTASIEPLSYLGPNAHLIAFLYETFGPSVQSHEDAASLQVALWELRHDKDPDLTEGNFYVRGATEASILNGASGFLAQLPDEFAPAPSTFVLASGSNPQSQHMIVPEPAYMAFGGFAVLSLGILFCRRR